MQKGPCSPSLKTHFKQVWGKMVRARKDSRTLTRMWGSVDRAAGALLISLMRISLASSISSIGSVPRRGSVPWRGFKIFSIFIYKLPLSLVAIAVVTQSLFGGIPGVMYLILLRTLHNLAHSKLSYTTYLT